MDCRMRHLQFEKRLGALERTFIKIDDLRGKCRLDQERIARIGSYITSPVPLFLSCLLGSQWRDRPNCRTDPPPSPGKDPRAWVKYEGRSPKFMLAPCHVMYIVHKCTHWLRSPQPNPTPHWDSFTRALLVCKDRWHLFVTPLATGMKYDPGNRSCRKVMMTWVKND